jgi:hypothetical protein
MLQIAEKDCETESEESPFSRKMEVSDSSEQEESKVMKEQHSPQFEMFAAKSQ